MSDVSVSLGVTGKDAVLGAFSQVGSAGKAMGETFGSIATKLAGLAVAFVGINSVAGAFQQAMNKGGELADFSEQTGIAVDKLVILGRAFENNGLAADDLGKVVNKMQKFLVEAGESGSDAADKLHKIGLFSSDLIALSPDEQLQKIGKSISEIKDPAERAAASMEIFGKSGGRMLALFADMPGAINQAEGEVGTFAQIMKNSAAEFDYLGDGLSAISQKLMEFASGVLSNVGGSMKEFIDLLKNFDAAGFGEKISRDIAAPLRAISNSLVDGNFKQALGVAYELAKLEAMKIGDQVIRILEAAFTTVAQFAGGVFASSGPIMVSLYNGVLDAGKFIGKTFKEAFLEAGSAAHAWVNLAISAMKMDLPGVIAGFAELNMVHGKIGESSYKTAQSWGEITKNALDAGAATYQNAEGFFDIATQQERVQSMSEKIVSDHEALAALTATIAANGKKYEESIVGVSESFGAFKATGGEAGNLAELAGLKVPDGSFKGTGLGPIDTPEAFSTKMVHGSMSTSRATDPLKDAMSNLLKKDDYFVSGHKLTFDQLQQRMETRASEQTASDLSYYTGGDSRASRSQAIDDLFRKYQSDGVEGTSAELRKKAEADFNALQDSKLGGVDSQGNRTGPGSSGGSGGGQAKPKDPTSTISETVKAILDHIKSSLPQHALSA